MPAARRASTVAGRRCGRDSVGDSSGDNRSYRVNFEKITNGLPGFRCARRADEGAIELRDCFRRIQLDADRFEFRAFTRLRQLEYLIETAQIDESFYWAT